MEQKREEGKKGAKKGGKLGQGVGALKRGGGWNTLTNYGQKKLLGIINAQ